MEVNEKESWSFVKKFRWVLSPDVSFDEYGWKQSPISMWTQKMDISYTDRVIKAVYYEPSTGCVRKWINKHLKQEFDIRIEFFNSSGEEIDSYIFKNAQIESHHMLLDYVDSDPVVNKIEFSYKYILESKKNEIMDG